MAGSHVRWCERSENESRKKTTSFHSCSIVMAEGDIEPLECSLQSDEKLIYLQKYRILWIRDL